MRVLVTGISGFVGSHLAEYLLSQGQEVYGIVRWRSKTENIDHIKDQLHLLNADIRDGYSLYAAFAEAKPECLFHLAAQSFVKESWNAPLETLSTNVLGTCNVLEAVRSACPEATVVVAGSSEEYGLVKPDETPIKETNPLRPMSPYGVSKVGTDLLGRLYHMSYGMQVIVARPFNTTGPRRGEVFATSNFAKQIAEIEILGKEPIIRVGNLEALRDWTDVRDMTRAYWLAATKCEPGEVYNICSGRTWKVRTMLEMLLSLSKVKVTTQQDPARMRPSDVPVLHGDASKFKLLTGWSPTIPLEQTMSDLLDYWRVKTKAQKKALGRGGVRRWQ